MSIKPQGRHWKLRLLLIVQTYAMDLCAKQTSLMLVILLIVGTSFVQGGFFDHLADHMFFDITITTITMADITEVTVVVVTVIRIRRIRTMDSVASATTIPTSTENNRSVHSM
ncbi:hypothetical protein M3Y94_00079400 [Aphelenchoides besseyi]|nr:hypothetical protein M3Y94_00079400 [Aphelenchoides besseyi]